MTGCSHTPFASGSGITRELKFSFAQRAWRVLVTLRDNNDNASSQVTVPVVFLCAALAFLMTITITVRIRSSAAQESGQKQLLSMIFPPHIATALISRLQVRDGRVSVIADGSIAQLYERVTLIFIDMCDFTTISSFLEPQELVRFVNEFVCIVDRVLARYPRLLKIKTIGDAYFVAGGLGDDRVESGTLPYHAQCLADALAFCLCVQREVQERHRFRVVLKLDAHDERAFQRRPSSLATSQSLSRGAVEVRRSRRVFDAAYNAAAGELTVQLRIGVHIGSVVAGVCGQERPVYDVWGDTCNVASRIESAAANGSIQVSPQVRDVLEQHNLIERFPLRRRRHGQVLKGVGVVRAYRLMPR
jgi:class 3 adenylate cyclase